MQAASISALTPCCIRSVDTAAVQQWLNSTDSCGQKTHTVSLWIRHGTSSFCCFLSSAHRNSCHMPSASVYFQGVKWGVCGRNSLCFVCHCPIGYRREGGLLCMIRERIPVSFVKLFLYKNNKNWSFSCTPFCQLQSPSVCLSSSFV